MSTNRIDEAISQFIQSQINSAIKDKTIDVLRLEKKLLEAQNKRLLETKKIGKMKEMTRSMVDGQNEIVEKQKRLLEELERMDAETATDVRTKISENQIVFNEKMFRGAKPIAKDSKDSKVSTVDKTNDEPKGDFRYEPIAKPVQREKIEKPRNVPKVVGRNHPIARKNNSLPATSKQGPNRDHRSQQQGSNRDHRSPPRNQFIRRSIIQKEKLPPAHETPPNSIKYPLLYNQVTSERPLKKPREGLRNFLLSKL